MGYPDDFKGVLPGEELAVLPPERPKPLPYRQVLLSIGVCGVMQHEDGRLTLTLAHSATARILHHITVADLDLVAGLLSEASEDVAREGDRP